MKHLLLYITVIINCAIGYATESRLDAIYDKIDSQHLSEAYDMILTWEKEDPNNSDLVMAKYNYFYAMGYNAGNPSDSTVDTGAFIIMDSDGNSVGEIRAAMDPEQVELTRHYYAQGDSVLADGLKRFPDELDLRIFAVTFKLRSDSYDEALGFLNGLLDRSAETDFGWVQHENMTKEQLKENLQQFVYDILAYILTNGDTEIYDSLLESLKKDHTLYPDDVRIPNLTGAIYANLDKPAQAEQYFKEAQRIKPDDGLVVCNIAAMELRQGNKEEALRIYNEALNDKRFDDNIRYIAKRSIEAIENESVDE